MSRIRIMSRKADQPLYLWGLRALKSVAKIGFPSGSITITSTSTIVFTPGDGIADGPLSAFADRHEYKPASSRYRRVRASPG